MWFRWRVSFRKALPASFHGDFWTLVTAPSEHREKKPCLSRERRVVTLDPVHLLSMSIFFAAMLPVSLCDSFLTISVGHKGKFGHEFMEFEFSSTGKLRYANNSNYKNDTMIRKEVTVSQAVLDEVRRIIQEADIIA